MHDPERRTTRGALRRLVLAAIVPACLLPHAARAQASTAAGAAPSCFDSIPASSLARVPVYLLSSADPDVNRELLPTADLLADLAARRVRAMLGGAAGELPGGGTTIGWRDLGPGLDVTLHRDGSFTWEPHAGQGTDAIGSEWGLSSAASDSLAVALAALRDAGERLYWPEGVAEDRATVHFHFDWQTISSEGKVEPPSARFAAPVFATAAPWQRPVVQVSMPTLRYPWRHQQHGISGTVVMRFVVDGTGGVDGETIRDAWIGDQPRPRGELGRYYRDFVRTVGNAIAKSRYEPALVGGCAVRQLVQQPFVFALR